MPDHLDIHTTADELLYRREADEAVAAVAKGGKPTKAGRRALRKATTAKRKAAKDERLAALAADLLAVAKVDLPGLLGLTLHFTKQVIVEPGFPKEEPHEDSGEPVIDVKAALRWFAARWHAERKAENRANGAELEPKPSNFWLEKWQEERALLAQFVRREREGELLDRDSVRESLAGMSAILRNLGVAIQQHYGPEAHRLVEDAIDDWERDSREEFGVNGGGHPAK